MMRTPVDYKIKAAAGDAANTFVPRPTDKLVTYSDYSVANRSGGGRLEIHRKMDDGSTKVLPGGYYSVTFKSLKKPMLACEGEAMTARAVIDFFYPLSSSLTTPRHTTPTTGLQSWHGKGAKEELYRHQSGYLCS